MYTRIRTRGLKGFFTLAIPAILAGVSGCSLQQRAIVSQVDRHNDAIEEVQNRMLLLNILRAAKQQPTYFTALTTVRGDATITAGTGNVTVPFGGGGNEAYSAVPNASIAIKPSFDMAVLDTQEFYKGFLQPVSAETLAFFLDQGWPRQLVLHMFIREIRFADGSRVTNTPIGDNEQYDRFREFVNQWTNEDVRIETASKKECLGPDIAKREIPRPDRVLEIRQAGFILSPGPCTPPPAGGSPPVDVFHFGRVQKELELRIEEPRVPRNADGQREQSNPAPIRQSEQPTRTPRLFSIDGSTRGSRRPTEPEPADDKENTIALRSPEAMVYYVGELIRRQQTDKSWKPMIKVGTAYSCPGSEESVLFRVDTPLQKDQKYTVVAKFEGTEFGIRHRSWTCASTKEPEDRSLHVMRLLSQIIALQKSGQSFPSPQTLRVVD